MNPADNLPGVNPDGSVSTQRMSDMMMKTDNAQLIEELKALGVKFGDAAEEAGDTIGGMQLGKNSSLCFRAVERLEEAEAENQQLKAHYQQAIKDLKDYLATEGDKG